MTSATLPPSDIPQAFQSITIPENRCCFLFDRAKWEKHNVVIRNTSLLGMIIVCIGEIIALNVSNLDRSYDSKVIFAAVFFPIMSIPTSIFFINLVLHLCAQKHSRT